MASSSKNKKPSPKRASGGKSSEKKLLLDELQSLLPQIDEEGLSFLIKQATTLIYNQKVEELNRSREVAENSRQKAAEKKKGQSEGSEVFFEAGKDRSTFFLDVDGKRAILDQAELMQMVRIAQAATNQKTARERVYRWLKTHRDDILFDCSINSSGTKIAALCERLNKDFAIRE